MVRYIGIDVHAQSCTIVVVGPSGKKLLSLLVETNGAALVQAVRSIAGERHICFEEGTQSAWLYELLEPLAREIVVCSPRQRQHQRSKNDDLDALDLAQRLRTGNIEQRVFKAPRAFPALREAVHAYNLIATDVARVKNRLCATFRSRAVRVDSAEIYDPDTRPAWIQKLPPTHRLKAEILGHELDALEDLRAEAEQTLLDQSEKHPIVKRIKTAPGIGPIRAAQIVTIVVTPHRFRTKRQFWSYCGLGIVTRSSADWVQQNGSWVRASVVKTRGLNRNRHPVLKAVFKGAAHQIVLHMHSHPLYRDYERMLAAGTKPSLAKLTLARRIAAAVLAMWKNGEVYKPERHQSHAR
jgi:transposase